MTIISWNYRGAGGKTFPTLIRDIRREYNANFIILLETHVSRLRGAAIHERIGFDNSFILESSWKVDVLKHNRQIVHLRLTDNNDSTWFLSTVYGNPQHSSRGSLWTTLHSLAFTINLPW
ncbi:hypothetical protein Ahy_B10g106555 [Arachis hypogaea]|uniref:Endonuclease/exonuclease/phosphatase domain-containing protein n=1 Tax=Arachis hypogaea TaxID=3818 RepID=A0A444XB71_ARAHY|nr:hypothetical protein Ahy_B10g106555 [Arachis hypogaea]